MLYVVNKMKNMYLINGNGKIIGSIGTKDDGEALFWDMDDPDCKYRVKVEASVYDEEGNVVAKCSQSCGTYCLKNISNDMNDNIFKEIQINDGLVTTYMSGIMKGVGRCCGTIELGHIASSMLDIGGLPSNPDIDKIGSTTGWWESESSIQEFGVLALSTYAFYRDNESILKGEDNVAGNGDDGDE